MYHGFVPFALTEVVRILIITVDVLKPQTSTEREATQPTCLFLPHGSQRFVPSSLIFGGVGTQQIVERSSWTSIER